MNLQTDDWNEWSNLFLTVSYVDKVLWSGQIGFITIINLILLTMRISQLTVIIILFVQ